MAYTAQHPAITEALVDLHARARRNGEALPDVTVRVGKPSEFPEHRAHAYCERGALGTGRGKLTIVYAPKLAESKQRRILGVLAHEFGHAQLLACGIENHTERDADRVAEALFGKDIAYDGAEVQSFGPGVRPRPGALPR